MNNETKDSGKLFTSKQVERILGERLAREKRQNSSLSKVRDLLMNLVSSGVLHSQNIPDMAGELEELLARTDSDNPGEAMSPTGAEVPSGAEVPADDVPSREKTQADENELNEFTRIFPGVDIHALLSDEEFLDYADGRQGSLISLYAGFLTARDEAIRTEEANRSDALRRGLASTGFSSGRSGAEDYSSILTPTQMRIAKNAGMSYKEYAEYLSQIKARKSDDI